MESALAIANYFIKKSLETGTPLTNMKLVKLVYLAHGWYLGLSGEPLLDEAIEAWKYGPVVPTIYHTFKPYGGEPINKLAVLMNESGKSIAPTLSNEDLDSFLDRIWEVYSPYSAVELSAMTHEDGTPWKETWDKHAWNKNSVPIPNSSIREYYSILANSADVPQTA